MQRTGTSHPAGADRRGVFALLRALVDSGLDLAHNTARMAASEGRLVLHRLAARLGLFVAGLLVAATGFLLGLVGAALVLARATGMDEWLAFVLVGAVTSAAGALLAVRAMRRLSEPDLAFPATLAEFEADVRTLRDGNRGAADGAP
jgi:hypothetical protein